MTARRLLALILGIGFAAACTSDATSTARSSKIPVSAAPASPVPAAPSKGCGRTVVRKGQTTEHLRVAGRRRRYLLEVPAAHDGVTPAPLVVEFHGYAGGPWLQRSMSGLAELGDAAGFITVTPQGLGVPARWDPERGSPDLAFAGRILDTVDRRLCIDTNRVYMTGMSNGAFMAAAVACRYPVRIAAVAPVAGVQTIPGCRPGPVPILAFHGTADRFLEYSGGLGTRGRALPAPDGSDRTLGETRATSQLARGWRDSVPASMRHWAAHNGCAPGPTRRRDAADVVRLTWRCPPTGTTELYRVDGGGHAWPGSPTGAVTTALVGRTTTSIDASRMMWQFFTEHPRREATG